MRVRFDGIRPKNELDGSRCSEFYLWHSTFNIVVDPMDATKKKRSTGDDPETKDNEVEPGNITLK